MTRWWKRQSVRTRLAWSYAATVALVLLAYSLGIFAFVSHVLNRELNDRLYDDFELAKESIQLTDEGVDLSRPRQNREHGEHQPWVEIWEAPARIRFRTPRAGSAMVDELFSLPTIDRVDTVQAVNGERFRSMLGIVRMNGVTYGVRVARSEEPLRHELRELFTGMLFASPFVIGLAGFVGAQMARRALRPMERMAEHAHRITAERLHDRLPVDNPNDELGQLAAVFNATLSRLERSFDQLRRFTADASHELRTPLTAIRSVGEVGLSEPHDATVYRDIIGSMLEEADRLTRLVDSLLTLARADASQVALRPEEIDLSDFARDVVNDLCVLAEEKHQAIRVDASECVRVPVDRVLLSQALVNLLHNAINYSPETAEIVVRVHQGPDGPQIEVIDRGPGIPSEHQNRIFDRFYRIDQSRTQFAGGTGLGLSIAHWAVQANGGTLELYTTGPTGSTFRIILPPART